MVKSDLMTDYANLSRTAKIRRVGRLARAALDHYPLGPCQIRWHGFETNLLYRVRTAGGERYMLRLASPGWRTLEDLQAEAMWLEALARDTGIGAPRVVRSLEEELVLPLKGPGVPHTWNATLMTWLPGRLLTHHISEANLTKMGQLFGRLHLHGKAWQPPEGFSTRRFDRYLSRGEPEVLFEDETMQVLAEKDRTAFRQARSRVADAYAGLDRADLRVIHCDLWHDNVKIDRGRLRPFDFEDTVWGFRLHDMAMGLLDLMEDFGYERYRALLPAFRQGYESLLDWPEGSLEVLQIGRLLWKANYVARFHPDSLGDMTAAYGRVFRRFEETGILRL